MDVSHLDCVHIKADYIPQLSLSLMSQQVNIIIFQKQWSEQRFQVYLLWRWF